MCQWHGATGHFKMTLSVKYKNHFEMTHFCFRTALKCNVCEVVLAQTSHVKMLLYGHDFNLDKIIN